MSPYFVLSIVFLVSGVTVLGDYFLKLSGSSLKNYIDLKLFIIGLFFYLLTSVGWFFIMKHMKLSTIGIVYGISTAIMLILVGTLSFKETLNTYEILGICLGIISLILLSKFAS